RVRTRSVLFLHELSSGMEWPLYDSLSKDQQEAWAIFGVYPGYAWTPDSKSLIIWSQGKMLRIQADSREVKEIPFTAKVHQRIRKAIRYRQEVAPDSFEAKML